jgi:hypothetical protein
VKTTIEGNYCFSLCLAHKLCEAMDHPNFSEGDDQQGKKHKQQRRTMYQDEERKYAVYTPGFIYITNSKL